MAVPGELRSWLHGVSDDDRPRWVLDVDDVGRAPVQLEPELQAEVIGADGAPSQRLGDDRWWRCLRRSRKHVCAASHHVSSRAIANVVLSILYFLRVMRC